MGRKGHRIIEGFLKRAGFIEAVKNEAANPFHGIKKWTARGTLGLSALGYGIHKLTKPNVPTRPEPMRNRQ